MSKFLDRQFNEAESFPVFISVIPHFLLSRNGTFILTRSTGGLGARFSLRKTALIKGNHLGLEGGPVSSHFDSDFAIRAVH